MRRLTLRTIGYKISSADRQVLRLAYPSHQAQSPIIDMQGLNTTIETREQRLLRLKYAVQRARVQKIKEYLEAIESDLQELEDATADTNRTTQRSLLQGGASCTGATNYPPIVVNNVPVELPAASKSEIAYDPISHSLVCEQLPRQLALLSTFEAAPSCSCGLPLHGKSPRNRNESVSLAVPPNSPYVQPAGDSVFRDDTDEQGACAPDCPPLLSHEQKPTDNNNGPTVTRLCNIEDSSEPDHGQHNDELPQPELYGEQAAERFQVGKQDQNIAGAHLDTDYIVFATWQPEFSFADTPNNSPEKADADLTEQKHDQSQSNNATRASSVSSYSSADSDLHSLQMMQQQQEPNATIFPTEATKRAYARGSSDVFYNAHIRYERKVDKDILLQADDFFSERMARQQFLNERLYMQGVLPGLPWSLNEREGMRSWNELQRNNPTRTSCRLRGLSWTRKREEDKYDSSERRGRDRTSRSKSRDSVKRVAEAEREDSEDRAVASINEKKDSSVYTGGALPPDIAGEIADCEEAIAKMKGSD